MPVSKASHIEAGIVEKAWDHLSSHFIAYVTASE